MSEPGLDRAGNPYSDQYHARERRAIKSDAAAQGRGELGRTRGLAGSSVVKAACSCRPQAAVRFSADAFPVLRLATTSKVTFWPSLSS
jgi:hypothetical protein